MPPIDVRKGDGLLVEEEREWERRRARDEEGRVGGEVEGSSSTIECGGGRGRGVRRQVESVWRPCRTVLAYSPRNQRRRRRGGRRNTRSRNSPRGPILLVDSSLELPPFVQRLQTPPDGLLLYVTWWPTRTQAHAEPPQTTSSRLKISPGTTTSRSVHSALSVLALAYTQIRSSTTLVRAATASRSPAYVPASPACRRKCVFCRNADLRSCRHSSERERTWRPARAAA